MGEEGQKIDGRNSDTQLKRKSDQYIDLDTDTKIKKNISKNERIGAKK